MPFRSLWLLTIRYLRRLDRQKSLWFRVVVCLCVGAITFWIDNERSYDTRFALRPAQPHSNDVIVVTVTEREWASLFPDNRNLIRPLKEITSLTDSFFWHEPTWQKLLNQILSYNPAAIGVTFYFGENLENLETVRRKGGIWTNEKIIWSADTDSTGRILYPAFSDNYASNVGLSDYRADQDLTVRSFLPRLEQVDHISWKLAHKMAGERPYPPVDAYGRVAINFLGPQGTFPKIKLLDILHNHVPPNALIGKVVIIGAEDTPGHKYLTPVGSLSKAELVANSVNNWLMNQWIWKTSSIVYFLYLLTIVGIAVMVMTYYPQSVALLIYSLIILILVSASAWLFDTQYFWLPAEAAMVTLATTYILFLSYELAQREKETWRLEQEKIYITEIEQLKHNFVSLISHDLKTPIARIQGVVDRLLSRPEENDLTSDLTTIRRSSDDLHRYIQSILQVSRVESRDLKVITQVVDINELVEQVIHQLQGMAKDKRQKLEVHLEPMFSIEVDPTLIREVLMNLIENAIKYTPEEGEIRVTSQEKDDTVRITVEDNGPGIDPIEQTRIWEKFYRGKDVVMKTKGTGLGMYLIKYFVELHGGQVFLKSVPGKGTTVGFSLPVTS